MDDFSVMYNKIKNIYESKNIEYSGKFIIKFNLKKENYELIMEGKHIENYNHKFFIINETLENELNHNISLGEVFVKLKNLTLKGTFESKKHKYYTNDKGILYNLKESTIYFRVDKEIYNELIENFNNLTFHVKTNYCDFDLKDIKESWTDAIKVDGDDKLILDNIIEHYKNNNINIDNSTLTDIYRLIASGHSEDEIIKIINSSLSF